VCVRELGAVLRMHVHSMILMCVCDDYCACVCVCVCVCVACVCVCVCAYVFERLPEVCVLKHKQNRNQVTRAVGTVTNFPLSLSLSLCVRCVCVWRAHTVWGDALPLPAHLMRSSLRAGVITHRRGDDIDVLCLWPHFVWAPCHLPTSLDRNCAQAYELLTTA
jgi:hypothetical protein